MTNEAISTILEHLCNAARNSAHAALGTGEFEGVEFGAVPSGSAEFARDRAVESRRASAAAADRAGLEQLLRSLEDIRELLSPAAPLPAAVEEFDLDRCADEIIEALNLTVGDRRTHVRTHVRTHMVLEPSRGPVLLTQDRKALEQLLTRVLDAVFKLARSSGVSVRLGTRAGEPGGSPRGVWLSIDVRDAELATRLAKWLNANPGDAVVDDPNTVSFELALMVAGKRLRELGGAAELERESTGNLSGNSSRNCLVSLNLPSQVRLNTGHGGNGFSGSFDAIGDDDAGSHRGQPEALQVLVAEDSDESFTLSALLLQDECVWRARDGAEALSMIRKQRFDMVLMDVHMPGMDGYEAIRGIRDWETQTGNARTPIVVLSADELETQRRSAAQCGCSGFLRKPVRQTDLTTLVDRLKQARMPVA